MSGFELIITKTEKIISEIVQVDNIKILTFLNQPSFSKSTKESYKRILRNFFSFFNNYGLKDITDVHVILYLKSLDKKDSRKQYLDIRTKSLQD